MHETGGTVKYLQFIITILIAGAILSAGCTTPESEQEKPAVQTEQNISAHGGARAGNTTLSPSDSDRYYYNIRIVPPSVLTQLEKELGADEYLIHNDNGDVIGVVSPRYLVLRGDLVQLEQGDRGRADRDYDKTDISEHLIDIAYGFDNARLVLFKSNKDYKFWFDGYYTQADLNAALEFSRFFNSISDTTQFEDEELELGFLKSNYEEIPYNFYNIKIVPDDMLDDFKDNRADTDHLMKDEKGTLIGIVSDDHLYLLDKLSEGERGYYMKKGVLYSMGMHGTSFNDRESFFYRESGINKDLNELDIEAVKLLYGGRLKSGMDIEEAKKTLGLTV